MGSILPFPARPSVAPPANANLVRLEAQHWENQYGRDAYSAFLLKHGKRPAPAEAEVIGKIVGRRVKASDGFRYPKLYRGAASTNGDRKKWQEIKRRHRGMTLVEGDAQPQPPS